MKITMFASRGRDTDSTIASGCLVGTKSLFAGLAAGVALACSATAASAITITFDELGSGLGDTQLPSGYLGFDWNNFYYFDGTEYSPGSGYDVGTASENNVAYNGFGSPASFATQDASTFTLFDFYLTGAWRDGLEVTITGRNSGSDLFSTTVTVGTSARSHVVLQWAGLDEVRFSSAGGVENPFLSGDGEHFAIDNIGIDEFAAPPSVGGIPEPGAWALMIMGFGGVGAAMRRRRLVAA